jgi:hypothetical protein
MKRVSLSILALALAAQTAAAAPVQWTTGSGGNGHWYELVTELSTWVNARTSAAARTHAGVNGYLATITSAAEQAFLNTAVNPTSVAAWLGGSDLAQEGTWLWVTEPGGPIPVIYANWATAEPNNQIDTFGSDEDYLQGWRFEVTKWNDNPSAYPYAYVVEYTPATVPVPAALPLLGAGIASLVALRRRKKA